MSSKQRRVVITGIGLVSPLGNSKEAFWEALCQARSGVGPLTVGALPVQVAAEARQFTGEIDDFGPLEKEQKKQIRKALRVMCRECQMGVAVAQLALTDAAIQVGTVDPDRIGISFGVDYMLSLPEEFNEGIRQCVNGEGKFEFPRWGLEGLPKMSPLWLLKYLPNMPASHVAIFNDLRGPSNSLTLREAASNLAVGEAYQIIRRGNADAMVCGATGTRLHAMKMVHAVSQEAGCLRRRRSRRRSVVPSTRIAAAWCWAKAPGPSSSRSLPTPRLVERRSTVKSWPPPRVSPPPAGLLPGEKWPWPMCCGPCCKTPAANRTRSITSTRMD